MFTAHTENRIRTTTDTHSTIRPAALLQLQHYHHINHAYSTQPRSISLQDYRCNSSLTRHSLPIAARRSGATRTTAQSATNPNGDRHARPPASATDRQQEADGRGHGEADAPDIRLQKASHQSPGGAPTAAAAFFSAAAFRRRLVPRPRNGGMARAGQGIGRSEPEARVHGTNIKKPGRAWTARRGRGGVGDSAPGGGCRAWGVPLGG
jgi:hypothetical protein